MVHACFSLLLRSVYLLYSGCILTLQQIFMKGRAETRNVATLSIDAPHRGATRCAGFFFRLWLPMVSLTNSRPRDAFEAQNNNEMKRSTERNFKLERLFIKRKHEVRQASIQTIASVTRTKIQANRMQALNKKSVLHGTDSPLHVKVCVTHDSLFIYSPIF